MTNEDRILISLIHITVYLGNALCLLVLFSGFFLIFIVFRDYKILIFYEELENYNESGQNLWQNCGFFFDFNPLFMENYLIKGQNNDFDEGQNFVVDDSHAEQSKVVSDKKQNKRRKIAKLKKDDLIEVSRSKNQNLDLALLKKRTRVLKNVELDDEKQHLKRIRLKNPPDDIENAPVAKKKLRRVKSFNDIEERDRPGNSKMKLRHNKSTEKLDDALNVGKKHKPFRSKRSHEDINEIVNKKMNRMKSQQFQN